MCPIFYVKIVTTYPPYRLVEGMLFLYNEKYEGGNSEKILLLCNKNYESPRST